MFLFSLFLPLIVAQKCNTDVLCKKEHMCNFDHDTSVRFNLSVLFFYSVSIDPSKKESASNARLIVKWKTVLENLDTVSSLSLIV